MTKKHNPDVYLQIIKEIISIKKSHPELRFGQIISNAICDFDDQLMDSFYILDEELLEGLQKSIKYTTKK